MRTATVFLRLLLTCQWRLLRHARWIADYEREERR
jgi:hypothetical protein